MRTIVLTEVPFPHVPEGLQIAQPPKDVHGVLVYDGRVVVPWGWGGILRVVHGGMPVQ